jgi:hypothetical protein
MSGGLLRSGQLEFECPKCGRSMIVMTDERGAPTHLGHSRPGCTEWSNSLLNDGKLPIESEFAKQAMASCGALQLVPGG